MSETVSSTSDSEAGHYFNRPHVEGAVLARSNRARIGVPPIPVINMYRPTTERQSGRRLYLFTLFTRLEDGSVKPFSFTFDRIPRPAGSYSRDHPAEPFLDSIRDSRISHSFRTTGARNVKVLITKGFYKDQHGVIVKSYARGKRSHRVLTSDGNVTTLKQINLRRIDPFFWLPCGVPVVETSNSS